MAKEFLGRGWTLPLQPDSEGRLNYASAEEKVRQSIMMILGTARGERPMNPEFGSRLHELLFAQFNAATKSRISSLVSEALLTWESRIEVLKVQVLDNDIQNNAINISIDYRLRATNSIFNNVFPFYLKEGLNATT